MLYPITSYVCETLPEKVRESTPRELFFEDLDRLVPEDVARICEWLTEKVDSFSAKIKPEAKEVEEEVIASTSPILQPSGPLAHVPP